MTGRSLFLAVRKKNSQTIDAAVFVALLKQAVELQIKIQAPAPRI